jgi:hypothetical protein
MIGKMPFEQMHLLVDPTNQPGVPRQLVKSPHSTTVDCPHPVGHFVVDILGSKHGSRLGRPLSALKPFAQFLFPFAKNSAILRFHSKCPPSWDAMFGDNAFYPMMMGVSSFFLFLR